MFPLFLPLLVLLSHSPLPLIFCLVALAFSFALSPVLDVLSLLIALVYLSVSIMGVLFLYLSYPPSYLIPSSRLPLYLLIVLGLLAVSGLDTPTLVSPLLTTAYALDAPVATSNFTTVSHLAISIFSSYYNGIVILTLLMLIGLLYYLLIATSIRSHAL